MMRFLFATVATGAWVNLSEFARNELLVKAYWTEHFEALGRSFPSDPVNGALWGLWGFLFAACIVAVRRGMGLAGTVALCWTMGFPLMWLVIGNLGVLPYGLLPIAVPLSLLEVVVGALIAQRILQRRPAA